MDPRRNSNGERRSGELGLHGQTRRRNEEEGEDGMEERMAAAKMGEMKKRKRENEVMGINGGRW